LKTVLFVVARLPSSMPVRAKISLPVHTGPRAPIPPGNRIISRSLGGSANVCVGTMLVLKVLPRSVMAEFCVGTGSREAAMMERERGCWRAMRERASRGPVASRSWKPGKRMRPTFVGRGEDMVMAARFC
jgi:hypothetical protein